MKIQFVGLTLVALAQAKQYTFNVVSLTPNQNSLCVKWGNNVQPLTSTIKPLYTGVVEDNNIESYKYAVCDNNGEIIEEEKFERIYTDETAKTNEVYNRQDHNNNITIPKFPEPFKPMFRMGSDTLKPFPKNVIYNVYAECDNDGYQYLVNKPFLSDDETNKLKINCTMNIIAPDAAYKETGLMHILGYGSRYYRKLSWGMKFDKKFMGRKSIKLRAVANDVTLIRENLSIAVYKATGVPVQEGTYARLFINNDVYGLYHMIDGLSGNWIASYIHGNPKAQTGISYEIASSHPEGPFAELKYLGEDYRAYSKDGSYEIDEFDKETYKENDEPSQWKPLIQFTKLYQDWVNTYSNDNSDKAIEELKKFLNIESTVRTLALESMILPLDNFWLVMSNVALYYNPERNNYQFLPYDFDEAMVGSKDDPFIDNDTFLTDCINWAYHNETTFDRYFVKNLMKHPQIKDRYDVILAKLSREVFTKDNVHSYVHAIADVIKDDVEWNFKVIDGLNFYEDGYANHFTYEEFEGNLDDTPLDYDDSRNSDDAPFGIVEWAELRSDACKDYTKTVDISKNDNISDNVDLSIPAPTHAPHASPSGAASAITISMTTFVLMTVPYLFYILF